MRLSMLCVVLSIFFVQVTHASECTSCDACPTNGRTDCGFPGITPEMCEANKCLWCPLDGGVRGPWCTVDTGLEATEECQAEDSKKKDCGFPGISAEVCEAQGCCFYPTSAPNTPWCYHAPVSDACMTCESCPLSARTDCGFPGITPEVCKANKCLWCPLKDGVSGPWCTFDTGLEATEECQAEDSKKKDCGFPGISAEICEAQGCCFYPTSAPNTPWCYYASASELDDIF